MKRLKILRVHSCSFGFLLSCLIFQASLVWSKTHVCDLNNVEAATCRTPLSCNDRCVVQSKRECKFKCRKVSIIDPITGRSKNCVNLCVNTVGSPLECGPGLNSCDCSCELIHSGAVRCPSGTYSCVIARQCGLGSIGSTLLWCSDPIWTGQPTCRPLPSHYCPPPGSGSDPLTTPCNVNFCSPSVFESIRRRGWGM
jgi:hypothetical protein